MFVIDTAHTSRATYYIDGQKIPTPCSKSGNRKRIDSRSTTSFYDNLIVKGKPYSDLYLTEKVYKTLRNTNEWNNIAKIIKGVVKNSYCKKVRCVFLNNRRGYTYIAKDNIIIGMIGKVNPEPQVLPPTIITLPQKTFTTVNTELSWIQKIINWIKKILSN